jgi:hypothetical protein
MQRGSVRPSIFKCPRGMHKNLTGSHQILPLTKILLLDRTAMAPAIHEDEAEAEITELGKSGLPRVCPDLSVQRSKR